MKPGAKFEVIKPPNSLAAKVPPHGGPSLESIVREAEQALRVEPRLATSVHRLLARCHEALGNAEAAARHAALAQTSASEASPQAAKPASVAVESENSAETPSTRIP